MTEERIKELLLQAKGDRRLPQTVTAHRAALQECLEDIERQRESRKALADSNIQLYQENGRLRVVIKRYAQHEAGCPKASPDPGLLDRIGGDYVAYPQPCSCGLDRLLP